MLILCLAWVIPLLLRLGMDAPLAVWGEQLARREPGSEASTFYSRLEFLLNAFFGFFPGILLWLPLLSRRFRSRLSLDADFLCFALGGFLIPALFFFLFPNSRPRYLAPSVPMVALPAGVVGSVLLAGESLPSAASLLRWSGRFFSLAALVGGTILAGRFWDAPYPLFPHGFAWSLLLLPFAAVALVFDRRRSAPVVSACLMLFLLCAVEIFLAKDTVKQHQRLHSRQTADRILEEIGEAEVLYTRFRNDFNIFYYVMRSGKRVIYVESLEDIPADTPQYVISIFPIEEDEYPQGEALRLRTLTKETGHPAYLHRIVQQIP
jgi:4-amino-4-deoxy-L-arabinose transferase-like glycosyltransferase